jgi:hypothetical protein
MTTQEKETEKKKKFTEKMKDVLPKIVETKVREWLRYDFSEEELKAFGLEMAQATQKASIVEDEKKAANANFKDRIEKEQLIARTAARHINTGFENRDIDCIKMIDYKKEIVIITRTDTGEVVDERDIRDEERQMRIV